MLKIEALATNKKLGVTDGVEYMANVVDSGKELIVIDNDFNNSSSIAYNENGFLNDEDFNLNFRIR